MKGSIVPNPRRSSACDCTCVLTRNQSLSRDSHACHRIVLFLPSQSSLTSFWRSFTGLVQLIFSFPSCFTLSDSTAPIRFIVKLNSLANYTLLIERQDHSVHMSSVLQVLQVLLYSSHHDSSFYHTMYVVAGSADLLFLERFHPFCFDSLLSYHHECLPLSLLPVGGAATGVQLSLFKPILLSSLPTSLRGGERRGRGRDHRTSCNTTPLWWIFPCVLGV